MKRTFQPSQIKRNVLTAFELAWQLKVAEQLLMHDALKAVLL